MLSVSFQVTNQVSEMSVALDLGVLSVVSASLAAGLHLHAPRDAGIEFREAAGTRLRAGPPLQAVSLPPGSWRCSWRLSPSASPFSGNLVAWGLGL